MKNKSLVLLVVLLLVATLALTACMEKDTYTVTFDSNGGSSVDSQSITDGSTATEPVSPTMDGYTFAGWYASGSDTAFDFSTTITANITLTAQWTADEPAQVDTFTVSFDSDVASQTVNSGSTATEPESLTKQGYTFAGWFEADSDTAFDFSTAITADISLVAQWTINTYTVSFGDSSSTLAYGADITAPTTNPTKDSTAEFSYEFASWNTLADGTGDSFVADSTVTGDITYYAQFTATTRTYTVAFDSEESTLAYGADITAPTTNPTKDSTAEFSYEFAGWYTAETEGTKVTEFGTVTGDITYYAQFTATTRTYTVAFDSEESTLAYGADITAPATNPTKASTAEFSYEFASWNTLADGTGDSFVADSTVTGDITYYAQFTATTRTYTVAFDSEESTLAYGADITAPTINPTKDSTAEFSYEFAGWFTAETEGTKVTEFGTVTGDITYYAQFTATTRTYTVAFDSEESTLAYGADITAPATNPTKASTAEFSYEFAGWFTAETEGTKVTEFGTVTGDITYYAQFNATTRTYTVTISAGSNGSVDEGTIDGVPYGSVITVSGNTITIGEVTVTATADTATSASTFAFGSWSVADGATTTDSTAITATFSDTALQYTYTFYNEDGTTVLSTATEDYGTAIVEPNSPTKDATAQYEYAFAGWFTSTTEGTEVTDFGNVTADVSYYAQYNIYIRQYTINFYNGNILSKSSTQSYGDAINTPVDPTKDSTVDTVYTFSGWNTEEDGSGDSFVADSTVTGAVTYYAQYTDSTRQYTITWYDEDGTTELATSTVDAYTMVSGLSTTAPTKGADAQYTYTFDAWTCSTDALAVVEDITFTASYSSTLNSYTVTFYTEDGTTELYSADFDYGSTPEYKGDAPTKDSTVSTDYTFAGWSLTEGGSVVEFGTVEGTVTYYAVFTESVRQYTITWYDEDGTTELYSAAFYYDSTPVYGGTTPTKASTDQYSYTFGGWDMSAVSGTASYTATYTATTRTYTVTISAGSNGSVDVDTIDGVPYGSTITVIDNTITIGDTTVTATADGATAQFTFSFDSWSVTSDDTTGTATTITASFAHSTNSYTVTFGSNEGELLEYGADITAPESNPTKGDTDEFTFTFAGWSLTEGGEVVTNYGTVTDDVTYYAIFTESTRTYTITWVIVEDTSTTTTVAYGTVPSYGDTDPTNGVKVFAGWDTTPVSVTGEATYTAVWADFAYSIGATADDNVTLSATANGDYYDVVITGTGAISSTWDTELDFTKADILSIVIGDGITSIPESFMDGYNASPAFALTTLCVGSSVTSIGDYAFSDCYALTSVTLSAGLSTIGNAMFYYCTGLETITIPASVTTIGDYAFCYCDALETVMFADNSQLQSIGDYAFYECTSLESITIPSSVITIGSCAFAYCTELSTVIVAEDSQLTTIGDYAFNECKSLQIVTFAEGSQLTTIGEGAFYGCTVLETVTFAEDSQLTTIGEGAFAYCYDLSNITIPQGTTTIGIQAFMYCNSLTSINIPYSVTSIGQQAFCSTKLMTIYCQATSQPAGWYVSTSSASYNWYAYTSGWHTIVWGADSITSADTLFNYIVMGGQAYITAYNSDNADVVIPDTIDGYDVVSFGTTFSATAITSIHIGSNINTIYDYSLLGCIYLASISVSEDNMYFVAIDGNLYNYDGTELLQYALGKEETTFVVPTSVTTIGTAAFAYSVLTSIELTSNVTTFEDYAFYCSSLQAIVLPNSVTSIGYACFEGCDNLASIQLSSSLSYIDDEAFALCSSLQSLVIPASVSYIGELALYGNTCTVYFESSSLPTVSSYWNYNFYGTIYWYSAETPGTDNNYWAYDTEGNVAKWYWVTVCVDGSSTVLLALGGSTAVQPSNPTKDGYTFTGWYTDSECTTAFSFDTVITAGTTVYAGWTEYYTAGLTFAQLDDGTYEVSGGTATGDIVIPATYYGTAVTAVAVQAFYGNTGVTSVYIPVSVTTIGSQAFMGCSNLATATIDGAITTIDGNAFMNCTSLTFVYLSDNVEVLGNNMFNACTNLTSVVFSKSISSIIYGAFNGCTSLTYIYYTGTAEQWYYLLNVAVLGGNNSAVQTATVLYDDFWTYEDGEFARFYTVTFDTNGGSSVDSQVVAEGDTLTTVADPTRDGHDFTGWYTDSGCTEEYEFYTSTTAITESITLYAGWEANSVTYLVTFDSNGGSSVDSQDAIDYGTGAYATEPDSDPEKTGYEFAGWVDADGTAFDFASTAIIADTTIYATWTLDTTDATEIDLGTVTLYSFDDGESLVFTGTGDIPEDWATTAGITKTAVLSVIIEDGITSIPASFMAGTGTTARCALTSVSIGNSVTSIGEKAFYYCDQLTEINIPASVETIGISAFASGSSSYPMGLVSVTFEEDSMLDNIGNYAFSYCDSLASINIENCTQLTTIGDYAFRYCYDLTSVKIEHCTKLTTIGSYAFYYCIALEEITIPASVVTIGAYAFSGHKSTSTNFMTIESVTFAEGSQLETIGNYAFSYCYSLTSINLEACTKLTTIGTYAFAGYSTTYYIKLTSIVIPNSVTSIGANAFQYWTYLTTVVIPSTMVTISSNAFVGCKNITDVYYNGTIDQWGDISITSNTYITQTATTKHYAGDGGEWVLVDNVWTIKYRVTFDSNEGSDVASQLLFSGDTATEPVYPTRYGYDFTGWFTNSDCTTAFDFNDTITTSTTLYAGWSLAEGYTEYTVTFEDGSGNVVGTLDVIEGTNAYGISHSVSKDDYIFDCWTTDEAGTEMFDFDTAINGNITLYAKWVQDLSYTYNSDGTWTVSGIGNYTGTTLVIPDYYQGDAVTAIASATSYSNGAFYSKTSLTSVVIGNNVTTIGAYAFYGCKIITTITLPASITEIGSGAFAVCSALQTVNYCGTIAQWCAISFGDYQSTPMYCAEDLCFMNEDGTFTAVTDLELTDDIISIGNYAFAYCDKITYVYIPSSVTSIGLKAFYSTGLESIEFEDSTGWYYGGSAGATTTSVEDPNASTSLSLFTANVTRYWTKVSED